MSGNFLVGGPSTDLERSAAHTSLDPKKSIHKKDHEGQKDAKSKEDKDKKSKSVFSGLISTHLEPQKRVENNLKHKLQQPSEKSGPSNKADAQATDVLYDDKVRSADSSIKNKNESTRKIFSASLHSDSIATTMAAMKQVDTLKKSVSPQPGESLSTNQNLKSAATLEQKLTKAASIDSQLTKSVVPLVHAEQNSPKPQSNKDAVKSGESKKYAVNLKNNFMDENEKPDLKAYSDNRVFTVNDKMAILEKQKSFADSHHLASKTFDAEDQNKISTFSDLLINSNNDQTVLSNKISSTVKSPFSGSAHPISSVILNAISQNQKHIVFHLNPKNLGSVRILIDRNGDSTNVTIVSEKKDGFQQLHQGMRQLSSEVNGQLPGAVLKLVMAESSEFREDINNQAQQNKKFEKMITEKGLKRDPWSAAKHDVKK